MRSSQLIIVAALLATPLAAQNPRASTRVDTTTPPGFSPTGVDIASSDDLTIVVWSDSGNNHVYARIDEGSGIVWGLIPPIQVDSDVSGGSKESGFKNGNPSLYMSGTNVYTAWKDGRNGIGEDDMYFARSTTNGVTWETDKRLDKNWARGTGHPVTDWCMFVSPDVAGDHIYVLIRVGFVGAEELYLVSSHDSGQTFSSAVHVPTINGVFDVDGLSLTAEGNTVHCVWSDDRGGSIGRDDCWYRKSIDGGSTFGSEVQVDSSGTLFGDLYSNPVVASSGSLVAVAWGEELTHTANEEVRVAISTNGGTSFAADELVTQANPLAVDADSIGVMICGANVVAFWDDDRTGSDACYTSFTANNGTTWSPNVQLTTAGGPGSPQFASDGDTTIYLTSEIDTPTSNLEANWSTDCGVTWGHPMGLDISDTAGDIDQARVAYNAKYNNAHYAWSSDESGDTNLYVGGYRLQTLTGNGFVAGNTTFNFSFSRFDTTTTPFGVVLASFSKGLWPAPFMDGRTTGLLRDALTPLFIQASAQGVFLATFDGSGSGDTFPVPIALPPGITFYAIGLGFDPAGAFGDISDVLEISF